MTKYREPFFNFSEPVPVIFSGILIAIFVLEWILPGFSQTLFRIGALWAEGGVVTIDRGGFPYWGSLIMHGFIHGDFMHVLVNALMICVFGILICRVAGSRMKGGVKFLAIFFIGVLVGGLTQWFYWSLFGLTGAAVGASGGASALLAGAAWVLGGRRQMLAWGLGWLVINILMMIFNFAGTGLQIAWAAHLGGYLGGMLLAPVLLPPSSTAFRVTR